jgi:hypothetical protein
MTESNQFVTYFTLNTAAEQNGAVSGNQVALMLLSTNSFTLN